VRRVCPFQRTAAWYTWRGGARRGEENGDGDGNECYGGCDGGYGYGGCGEEGTAEGWSRRR
jgi:hypothetical protein